MLSGNGRHRRPRQAPALVVAAGVTGSAIAIPLIGATGASAEEAPAWDRLAACESGGLWSAHLGNGFYGGLQLSQKAWEDYGGLDYAPRADLASRSQQIAVAEKVLADQGPDAWPTCAPVAHLVDGGSGESGAPEAKPSDSVDDAEPSGGATASPEDSESAEPDEPSTGPDSSETPEPSDSADASPDPSATPDPSDTSGSTEGSTGGATGDSKPGDTGKGGDSGKGGKEGESDKGDKDAESPENPSGQRPSDSFGDGSWVTEPGNSGQDGTPSPDDTATDDPAPGGSGTGRHRGDEADEGGKGDGRDEGGSGRHASRDGREGGGGSYTVRPGDNLWAIAEGEHVEGGWTAVYDLNRDVVGSDPDLILPGQSLDLGEK